MAAALEILLLGPPRVSVSGRPVGFDTRKAVALLAHLALAERPRSREALCDLLWSGQDAEHARGALRRTLSVLRKGIGEQWLDATTDSVALRDGPGLAVDVRGFRELAADDATLAKAVCLFRGSLLEGFSVRDSPDFEAWWAYEADALERELATALGRLVELLVARGEYPAALAHARRWLALDALHEPAHRALIRLYALGGDRAAALTQYRDCVRTLSQELGVGPVEETVALFEQVSEGTLVMPVPAPHADPVSPPEELPLVGRSEELERLLAAHHAAGPDGQLVVIEGEAGIGKSRLARELTGRIAGAGGTVLAASCHDDEAGLPYGPVLELLKGALAAAGATLGETVSPQRLADASLLFPTLADAAGELPPPVPLTAPGAQARMLDALAAVLGVAGEGPCAGALLVDDVHAADEATLDVLAYLGRRLAGRPLLLVLTWRGEAVPPGHRLRPLAATTIRLKRLQERDVLALVRSAQPEDPEALAQRVFAESEGLPLFVGEYLAAISAGEVEGVPRELRDVLDSRLAGLAGVARQVLETAAVVGRDCDVDTLRAASGRTDEETADGLEQLVARGLLRETADPAPGYDFTHGKLREHTYQGIGLARRRLLHRRVAGVLLRSAGGSRRASLAAVHLRAAGDDAGAAVQHRQAAEDAAAVLAHRDALEHLDAALALGHPDAAELHERNGDLRTLAGDYPGALASYERAAAEGDGAALARIEHKLGDVHARRGEWERAAARFAIALQAPGAREAALSARILADLSLTTLHSGQPERAAELAQEARTLAESASDLRAQAQSHNLLGALARRDGRLEDAGAELQRSLALAEQLENPAARAAALNNLALVAQDAGDLELAVDYTREALELCVAFGDRHREAALENALADLHHAAGRTDESMEHLKRAVAIFAEVGGEEATRLPEIWKLVSW